MKFLAVLMILGVQTSFAQESIVCFAEKGSGFNKAEVIFNGYPKDGTRSQSITVSVDNGRKIYKDARGHSGGEMYGTRNGRSVKFYSRDFCASWEYITSGGGLFSSRKVEGLSCNYQSPGVTLHEVTFEDTREMYIEKIRIGDFYSPDPIKYVDFFCEQ